jgi:hypothetical protein
MFCAFELVFDGTEGVGSCFHVLRSRTHFGRYRRRRVPFSCFALPDSFGTVPKVVGPVFMFCAPEIVWGGPRASGPIFKFCAHGHIFGGTEGVGSHFHVSHSRTRFRRYRWRRVPFSCFVLPNPFWAVSRASGAVFTFCAPRLILTLPRASGPVFMFCAPGLVFDGTEGVGSRLHILRYRTNFRWNRRRLVPF